MKLLFDLFPLLIFFAAFKFYDIYFATAAAIVATVIQVGVFWFRHRRFETVHLITLVVISVFGGLTIAFQDDVFIKWKPSIVNWLFAVGIFGVQLFGKRSALERLLGDKINLPAHAWKNLSVAWGIFFLVMGALNVYVAFYYDLDATETVRTATWVNFKVFGLTGLSLVFVIGQTVFISRYVTEDEDG